MRDDKDGLIEEDISDEEEPGALASRVPDDVPERLLMRTRCAA